MINKPVNFDLGKFDKAIYDGLSDSLKAIIAKSPEYQQLMGSHKVEQHMPDDNGVSAIGYDDDIPF